MQIKELRDCLELKVTTNNLPSSVFLGRMRMTTEDSRKTAAYQDPRYVPFYYWLGTQIQPKNMVEIGFRLGLFSACFLKSCKTVEKLFAFQEHTSDFYSPKLGISNVKDNFKGKFDFYVGKTTDDQFDNYMNSSVWDLVLINEESSYDKHRYYLDLAWGKMSPESFLVMDYVDRHPPSKEAYFDFCKLKNREPMLVSTRYGVGILQK